MADEKKEPKKRGGYRGPRPKVPQTMPLILSATRVRVSKELPMDGETAALVDSYSSWASKVGGITKDEAIMLLLGKAIPAFTKKDNLFQQEAGKAKGAPAPTEAEE